MHACNADGPITDIVAWPLDTCKAQPSYHSQVKGTNQALLSTLLGTDYSMHNVVFKCRFILNITKVTGMTQDF